MLKSVGYFIRKYCSKVVNTVNTVLCPYCFDRFLLRTAPFRCANLEMRCRPENDPVYTNFWKISVPMGKVISPDVSSAKSWLSDTAVCPSCKFETSIRICPHCHMELPHTIGVYSPKFAAVIGSPSAGKTHFITVLVDQLLNNIGPQMNFMLSFEGDQTIEKYQKQYYEQLFTKKKLIPRTVGVSENTIQSPMQFAIRPVEDTCFGKNVATDYISLIFYDAAGEDTLRERNLAAANKYIYNSNGIILVIDPLQIQKVRDLLPEGTLLPESLVGLKEVLTRTTRVIYQGKKLGPKQKIDIPIAVCLSKLDAITPLLPPQSRLRAKPIYKDFFDYSDFQAIQGEIRSLLLQWGLRYIVQMLETRYKRYGYFAMSALGSNPAPDAVLQGISPHRVADPFLWLLAEDGIISKTASS